MWQEQERGAKGRHQPDTEQVLVHLESDRESQLLSKQLPPHKLRFESETLNFPCYTVASGTQLFS